MKYLFKCIAYILSLFSAIVALLYATDNQYIIKGFKETYLKGANTATIDDWRSSDNAIISRQTTEPKEWMKDERYNQIPLTDTLKDKLEKERSVSFIIARDGKLLSEYYWNGHEETSLSNSFSMAKSVVTLLLGFAIQDGYVKSLDQSILDFLPEYRGLPFADQVTIADLSRISSGLDWKENYHSPFNNPTAKAYYGTNVEQLVFSKKFMEQPGKEFKYLSANTQLLTNYVKKQEE